MLIIVLLFTPVIISAAVFLLKSRTINIYANLACSIAYLAVFVPVYMYHSSFTPYFRIDDSNILFFLILSVLYFCISVYQTGYLRDSGASIRSHTYYTSLFLLLIASMAGAVASTNLAFLWVFIEATTLTSAYLIYFNHSDASLEAVWKYIFICSIGISMAFVGILFLSIGTGGNSLFFDDLMKNASGINHFWLKMSFIFIVAGFGTKMGLAPVHAWLPDAHSEAPAPVSAVLSGALLNTAFLGIFRVDGIVNAAGAREFASAMLMITGFLSVFVCAVYVLKTDNYKRMLAYSSIENMGIAAMGLGLGGSIGIYAALLHLFGHSLTKSSIFMTSGNIHKIFRTRRISRVSGLLRTDNLTGWLFLILFTGLAGMPPFPIFLSEFLVIKAFFLGGHFILGALFILLLTIILAGMARSVIKMVSPDINNETGEVIPVIKPDLGLSYYLPQIVSIFVLLTAGIPFTDFLSGIIRRTAGGF